MPNVIAARENERTRATTNSNSAAPNNNFLRFSAIIYSEPRMPGIRNAPNMFGSSRNALALSSHVNRAFWVANPKIPMQAATAAAKMHTFTNLRKSRSVHSAVTKQLVIEITTTEVKATNWNATSGLSSNETEDV